MAHDKAPNGAGGIRTRTRADGRTDYSVHWSHRDPATGARKRTEKRGFGTRQEAERFRRRVAAEADAGVHVPHTRLRVGDYLTEHLNKLVRAPQTLARYRRDARLHIVPHVGHLRLDQVTARQLNDLYHRLLVTGSPGGNGPLSLASVRHVHTVLSGMYTRAVSEHVLGGTPPTAGATPPTLKQIKSRRAPITLWTAEQLSEFLEGTRTDHYGALWRLLATTGMRRGGGPRSALGRPAPGRGVPVRAPEPRRAPSCRRHAVARARHSQGRPRTGDRARPRHGGHAPAAPRRAGQERLALGDRWEDRDLVFARGRLWLREGQRGGTPLDPDRVGRAGGICATLTGAPIESPS